MRKFKMIVYRSEEYEVEVPDDDKYDYHNDPDWLYQLVCDNGYEPVDFGVDEIILEELEKDEENNKE